MRTALPPLYVRVLEVAQAHFNTQNKSPQLRAFVLH
jgi:hypothetical protein